LTESTSKAQLKGDEKMGIWAELNVKAEQRQDMLRQAAQQRLIRQALASRRRSAQQPDFQEGLFHKIRLALAGLLLIKFHLQTK
jgi:hypothetical protein